MNETGSQEIYGRVAHLRVETLAVLETLRAGSTVPGRSRVGPPLVDALQRVSNQLGAIQSMLLDQQRCRH